MEVFDKIGALAQKYNIPFSIWRPIVENESGGVANAVASTSKEYSVGLFQINTLAHPQYAVADLLDPIKNTEIAFRDFIRPALDYVEETYPDITPKKKAELVYFGADPDTGKYFPSRYGGIRPALTTRNINVFRGLFDKYKEWDDSLNEFYKDTWDGIKSIPDNIEDAVSETADNVKESLFGGIDFLSKGIVRGFFLLLLFLILVGAVGKLFVPDADLGTVVKLLATKGASK